MQNFTQNLKKRAILFVLSMSGMIFSLQSHAMEKIDIVGNEQKVNEFILEFTKKIPEGNIKDTLKRNILNLVKGEDVLLSIGRISQIEAFMTRHQDKETPWLIKISHILEEYLGFTTVSMLDWLMYEQLPGDDFFTHGHPWVDSLDKNEDPLVFWNTLLYLYSGEDPQLLQKYYEKIEKTKGKDSLFWQVANARFDNEKEKYKEILIEGNNMGVAGCAWQLSEDQYTESDREAIKLMERAQDLGLLADELLQCYKDRNNNSEERISFYQKALKLGNPHALLFLAEEYAEKGEGDLSVQYYKEAASLGNLKAFKSLGDFYFGQKNQKEAIYYYERAVFLEDEESRKNLLHLYFEAKDFKRIIDREFDMGGHEGKEFEKMIKDKGLLNDALQDFLKEKYYFLYERYTIKNRGQLFWVLKGPSPTIQTINTETLINMRIEKDLVSDIILYEAPQVFFKEEGNFKPGSKYVFFKIIDYLDHRSLAALSQASHNFHDICKIHTEKRKNIFIILDMVKNDLVENLSYVDLRGPTKLDTFLDFIEKKAPFRTQVLYFKEVLFLWSQKEEKFNEQQQLLKLLSLDINTDIRTLSSETLEKAVENTLKNMQIYSINNARREVLDDIEVLINYIKRESGWDFNFRDLERLYKNKKSRIEEWFHSQGL